MRATMIYLDPVPAERAPVAQPGAAEEPGSDTCAGHDIGPVWVAPVRPDEALVVAAEVRRHASIEKRPSEVDPPYVWVGIPGVADPVAVRIPEVVCLPGVRREHDRDTVRAEEARADDEWCEADSAS